MSDKPKKMSLESMDISKEKIRQFKSLFPEVFREGKVDFEQLKRVLGDWVDTGQERFGLSWPGKAECIKVMQAPAKGTLKPCKEESVNWDTTENLFIEGDNLEVLKLLQKSYFGKVKMIYIDPPYNTGKEFIYPDKFSESLDTYLRYTGQKDSNGHKFSTNSDTDGRVHSRWLNMMYPRLCLARNLLREDGIIFISIDDNEQANLKKICDEIFGEENFVGSIGWESKMKSQNTRDSFNKLQPKIEYILCYGKQEKRRFNLYNNGQKEYPEKDERGAFRYDLVEQMSRSGIRGRESMVFPILGILPKEGKQWQVGVDTIKEFNDRQDVIIKDGSPYLKKRKGDERNDMTKPFWAFFPKEYGTAESAKKELSNIFGEEKHGFETVKPVGIIERLVFHATDDGDIILDFFAGSSTTAHAVMKANQEYGGHRNFIMVQLPETIEDDKIKYDRISQISKKRINLAINGLENKGVNKQQISSGFRVLYLDKSCFKDWDDRPDQGQETLIKQMQEQVDYINSDASTEDILYELLLKDGFPLTTLIEPLSIQGKTVYSIENGALLICLERELTEKFIDGLASFEPTPSRVICLDAGFRGNDQLKCNAVHIFKTKSHHKGSDINFLTI